MTGEVAPFVAFGPDGLAPAIVQDAADGRVLMLAYMDTEALEATVRTGDVHFHSRSRDVLWRKGETSGNTLRMLAIAPDCDGDALLVTVDPAGPTCHRGTRSCFDPANSSDRADHGDALAPGDDAHPGDAPAPGPAAGGFGFLDTLWSTIRARAAAAPPGSYTARLLEGGVDAVGRKVTEEATEVLLAARDDAEAQSAGRDRATTRDALASETADLLYHALVLLAERGVAPADVIDTLRARHRP